VDLPLNALRAFAVSARHLNFARAADELHLSPTAVSQHVKNLEARYGVRLFHRLPRGLALTDEGGPSCRPWRRRSNAWPTACSS
jgi:LysR family transcriptional regulator of beta-lactamase